MKSNCVAEISKLDSEISRSHKEQNSENTKIQQAIIQMNEDEVAIKKSLLNLSRRIEEVQLHIGLDDVDL